MFPGRGPVARLESLASVWPQSLVTAICLARKSVGLDLRILSLNAKSLAWRIEFLARKYSALAHLRFGPARFAVVPLSLTVRDVSGLGTLQSSIADFYDEIVCTCGLGTAPIIIDVGANIGQFANAAKLFYPGARVICFEPDPDAFADLKVNTAGFAMIEAHNVGLGRRAESRTFYRHRVSVMSSFRSSAHCKEGPVGMIELPLRRLDDVISPEVRPDLLKVDVEGFERQVLEGAWETLRRSRYLLLEMSLEPDTDPDNLRLLHDIVDHVPRASVLRFGRPLGERNRPMAQDILMAIQP